MLNPQLDTISLFESRWSKLSVELYQIMKLPCRYCSLAETPVPYRAAYDWQLALHAARKAGEIPDTLLLLEHPAVITAGRGARNRGDLLTAPEHLADRGIEFIESDRGGEMTYHAPGQLVGYVIMDLAARGKDLHKFLRDLEESIIRALAALGVEGRRIPGLTGVWVGERKICAMGIKVSHWITMHGFALNIDPDMDPFRHDFIPCGIRDKGVVSLAELGVTAHRGDVERAYLAAFAQVFGCELERVEARELPQCGLIGNGVLEGS